jgi:hypothetical protein
VPKFVAKGTELRKLKNKKGQLCIEARNFDQLHVDQHNPERPLFVAEELLVDLHQVLALSDDNPNPERPFRKECVEKLSGWSNSDHMERKATREGKQDPQDPGKFRKMVQVVNFWGTVLDENGRVLEWEGSDGNKIPLENVFFTIANEEELIRDPIAIPRWSGNAPITHSDLLRAPGQGIKAIMDAGSDLNQAENELTSAVIDGALREAQNINWYRKSWLSDKRQASGGFRYGDSVAINDDAPVNGEAIGTVKSGQVPAGALNVLGIIQRYFAENVFSNLLDLSGAMPSKQVRATEVVQANQAIGDIFESLAADVEEDLIEPFLLECFLEIMQNSKDLSEEEVLAAYHGNEELAGQFLALTPQERFAEAANGFRFVAKGLRGQIASASRAQMAINFLNTLSANPLTLDLIQSTISLPKVAMLIAKGLGFDMEEISTDPNEKWFIQLRQAIREQAIAQAATQEQGQQSPSQGTPPAPEQPGPMEGL